MKKKTVETMDENDERMCGILQQLGFKMNVAKVLIYLVHNKEGMSKNIEQAADLRQPEVSVGIGELRRMGVVGMTQISKESKGRPIHRYALKKSPSEVKKQVHDVVMKQIDGIQSNLKKFEELFSSIKE